MAEYIEREHLKDKFTRYLNAPHVRSGYSVGQGMRVAIKTCIAMLDEEPTADVAPVRHGTWIWKNRRYGGFDKHTGLDEYGLSHTITVDTRCEVPYPICPYCGKHNESIYLHYCPNCGAKMDGGDGA